MAMPATGSCRTRAARVTGCGPTNSVTASRAASGLARQLPTPGGTVEVGACRAAGRRSVRHDGRRWPAFVSGELPVAQRLADRSRCTRDQGRGHVPAAPLGAKRRVRRRTSGARRRLDTQARVSPAQPGFDNWKSDDPFVNGVIVRTVAHAGNVLTNTLVDATPGSAQGMKDAPLMPGHALTRCRQDRHRQVGRAERRGGRGEERRVLLPQAKRRVRRRTVWRAPTARHRLEFRQPQPGFDNWKSDDPFVNGVIVRTVAHAGN